MQLRNSAPICSVSNIKFTVHNRLKNQTNNKISFKQKKPENKQQPEKDQQISMIRKHIQSFMPVSCCNPKKNVAITFNTCHRQMKPLKGLQLTYKRFPIRKALSASCINFNKRQKKFCMGPENSILFSNKIINESIVNSPKKSGRITAQTTHRVGSAYGTRRRSLPANFQNPLSCI